MVIRINQNCRPILLLTILSFIENSFEEASSNVTIGTQSRYLRSAPPTYSGWEGPCGYGNINDGTCSDSTTCCTPNGWCVSEKVYCTTAQRNTTQLPCGYGNVGNGTCLASATNSNVCCSVYGWCGEGSNYCRNPFTPPPSVSPSPSKPLGASGVTSRPSKPPSTLIYDGTYYPGEGYYLYPDPTSAPKGTCGNGKMGDGICPNPDLTCFEDGYCRKKNW